MPHVSLKMIKGRTDEQKQRVATAIKDAVCKELGVGERHVSVTVEDYTAEEWQKVFAQEVDKKKSKLFIKPDYDPKELLKKQ